MNYSGKQFKTPIRPKGRRRFSRRRHEHGSSILESMMAIVILSLVFFGMMQLFFWGVSRMFCDYASFYAAKAHSLGYAKRTVDKSARIAAIPISGPDESKPGFYSYGNYSERLPLYMSTGNSGVHFAYWDSRSGREPELNVKLQGFGDRASVPVVSAETTLENAPFLHDGLANFLNIGIRSLNPSGKVRMYNYSQNYLE